MASTRTRVRACACINRSYVKPVNGEQFEDSRRRRRGSNFGPRGPAPPSPRRGAGSSFAAANTSTAQNFRRNLVSPSSPLVLSLSLAYFHFALPLPCSNETSTSGAHHTTHSNKGLCIATGPGNISFRKITGSRRGCQCIKQTSLRLPYT